MIRDDEFHCPAIDNAIVDPSVTVTHRWRQGRLDTEVDIDGYIQSPEVLHSLVANQERIPAWIMGLRHELYVKDVGINSRDDIVRRVSLRSWATMTRRLHPVVLRREEKRRQQECAE